MADDIENLKIIVGEQRLTDITTPVHDVNDKRDSEANSNDDPDNQTQQSQQPLHLTNAKDIHCDCKTIILRANHAKLILTTPSMEQVERQLRFSLQNKELSKTLAKGCYWLVDDMYKFEQIGFTKEVKQEDQHHSDQADDAQMTVDAASLRYLVCAECNLCPLGWFDSRTKESYLYVW